MKNHFQVNSIPNLPHGQPRQNTFKFYLDRHNIYVETLAKQLNGLTYRTAPFDISTSDRQFYEVKVTSVGWRSKGTPNRWIHARFTLTTDELKFMHLMKEDYHLIIVFLGSPNEAFMINYKELCGWEPQKYHQGFKKQKIKFFDLSGTRISILTPFPFPMEN
jgi:hypothetical protein